MREYNLKLDDVINDQRNVIYTLRNNLLKEETNMIELVIPMIEHSVDAIAKQHLFEGMLPEEWDFTSLTASIKEVLAVETLPPLSANDVHSPEDLQIVLKDTISSYIERVQELNDHADLQQSLRYVGLHFLDQNWVNHLDAMTHLKEGIGLRQYQQEDPTRLYQKEGLDIFLYTYGNFEKEMCRYIARHLAVPENVQS
jgi:preprotein translocase subunit SecA